MFFDAKKSAHWLWLAAGLVVGGLSSVAIFDFRAKFSRGDAVRVIEKDPEKNTLGVGDTYTITLIVKKLRGDCSNGRLTRHMYEINTGIWYMTEDIETLQLPVGTHPLSLDMPTVPMRKVDRRKMGEGLWQIRTKISYDCPTTDGIQVVDYTFSTPSFRVQEDR